jgi:hypothetical protein
VGVEEVVDEVAGELDDVVEITEDEDVGGTAEVVVLVLLSVRAYPAAPAIMRITITITTITTFPMPTELDDIR